MNELHTTIAKMPFSPLISAICLLSYLMPIVLSDAYCLILYLLSYISCLLSYLMPIVYAPGDASNSLEPRKVEQLCKKGVREFAYGSGPHVLAVTNGENLLIFGCSRLENVHIIQGIT